MSYKIELNDLIAALEKFGSKSSALKELGYSSKNSTALKKISKLIIDNNLTHLLTYKNHIRKAVWDKEILLELVKNSTTFTDVLIQMGLQPRGGNCNHLKSKLDDFAIDYSHFGRYSKHFKHYDDVFIKDKNVRHYLVKKKFLEFTDYKCSECNNFEWRGKKLKLELDHINGINYDHTINNLRLLCPNCHSQTETYNHGKSS